MTKQRIYALIFLLVILIGGSISLIFLCKENIIGFTITSFTMVLLLTIIHIIMKKDKDKIFINKSINELNEERQKINGWCSEHHED